MTDLWDWADVAAIGLVAAQWFDERDRPVLALLDTYRSDAAFGAYTNDVRITAAALRSAYAAGREDAERERGTCGECASWLPESRWCGCTRGLCGGSYRPAHHYCPAFVRRQP